LPQRGPQGEDAGDAKCGGNARVSRLHWHGRPSQQENPTVAERRYPLVCSYFLTPETATHFGGVPESICPEGQGSVGFGAAEGGPA
jgi:hypothetical protein